MINAPPPARESLHAVVGLLLFHLLFFHHLLHLSLTPILLFLFPLPSPLLSPPFCLSLHSPFLPPPPPLLLFLSTSTSFLSFCSHPSPPPFFSHSFLSHHVLTLPFFSSSITTLSSSTLPPPSLHLQPAPSPPLVSVGVHALQFFITSSPLPPPPVFVLD